MGEPVFVMPLNLCVNSRASELKFKAQEIQVQGRLLIAKWKGPGMSEDPR